ncbi:MAG: gliding motility-associated C-terminal domain-containing protein [Bacteroidota bacterium]
MNPVAHFIPRLFGLLFLYCFCCFLPPSAFAQGSVVLTVTGGDATTTCNDLFSAPDPQWAVQVEGEEWVVYPSAGGCFTDPPFVQYDSLFNCPTDVPLQLEVCLRVFEDDGFFCNPAERCEEQICASFPISLPGNSVEHTLELPTGLSSGGSVTFTIETGLGFAGGLNDIPCTAFDLGLIARATTVGDASLSNYNNFCATNVNEPDPELEGFFRNDHSVWFTFTTPTTFSPLLEIVANSDPQQLGADINLQLALYESSNDSCTGNYTLLQATETNNIRDKVWRVKCADPGRRYWLMVDGGFDLNTDDQGYFGLSIRNFDTEEGPDFICDATDMGAIPPNGFAELTKRSNICATDLNDPQPSAFVAQKNVWFSFLAPATGHVLIEAFTDAVQGDPINTQLAVFRSDDDTCTGNLEEVGSRYRANSFDEQLELTCLDPGRRYWVLVDGAGNKTTGIFDIRISDDGPVPPKYTTFIDELICFGESLQIGDSTYTRAGQVDEIVRAADGCDSLITGSVSYSPEISTSLDSIVCAGASVTIGTDVFTISGSYAPVLQADNGCDSTINFNLLVLDPILVNANQAQEATGYLEPDGTANVTASGGAGNFTYEWSDGQTGAIAFNLLGGRDYCVTVTDGQGCTAEDCVLILFPSNILSTVISDTLDCIGDVDGSLSISISNGAWPYDYDWENGDGTLSGSGTVQTEGGSSTVNGLPTGTYSFTISDGFGFAAVVGEVLDPEPIITQLDTTLCFGESIQVGTDTYDANGQINTVLTSAKGCDSTVVGTLVVLPLNETILDETLCFGENLQVGSTTYSQSGPIFESLQAANGCDSIVRGDVFIRNEVFSRLDTAVCAGEFITVGSSVYAQSGSYTDVYRAANGCDSTVYTELIVQSPLTVQTSLVAEASALNAANGVARVAPSGGSGSYTYLWSNGQITSTATNLTGGQTYCVVVTDEIGCSASDCIVMLFPVDIRSDVQNDSLDCFGGDDGLLSFSAFNGQPPYQYTWEGLNTGLTGSGDIQTENGTVLLTDLPADQYSVTISDQWGEGIHSMEVWQPEPLEVELLSSAEPQCFGFADGSISARIQGGTAPYFYLSNPIGATFDIDNTFKGDTTYRLIVTDQNACTAELSFQIGQPEQLTAQIEELSPVSCFGGADGQARVQTNAVGATYLWDNGTTGATVNGLEGGFHSVTVTDQDGCTVTANISIGEPLVPLSALVELRQPIRCPGGAEGVLEVQASGGQGLRYLWSNGSTAALAEDLTAGTYTVSITDDKGCTTEAVFDLSDPTPLDLSISTEDVTCSGGELSGLIQIDAVSGGEAPYVFSLDGQNYGDLEVFARLPSGGYEVHVRDALGCVKSFSAVVNDPDYIIVSLGTDRPIDLGETTVLNAQTDSDQPIYQWSTPDSTSCQDCSSIEVAPLFSSVYQVTVTDAVSGCTATDEIRITVQKERKVFIPNVFTPNNDGRNDVFTVFPGIGVAAVRKFQVFNRWGARMYEIQNMDPANETHGWNGMYKGQLMDPGVYVYSCELVFKDGEVMVFQGDVTLVR